ncbi:MAG: sialidase, partial [Candidatus Aminicenantes bacterium]|nr:sialidase [Candidatus Aminicenantes bacterium]
MKLKVKSGPVWGVLSLLVLAALSFGGVTSDLTPDVYKSLEWRHIGPIGNRVIAVTGVPGNPYVLYCGAASGGIFKTTDGGSQWNPVFDGQSVSSIGSLAVAPSDFNVIWAGTGETFIRSNISLGDGIYRSTDEGRTWTCMGLEKTGRIGRIAIHPGDPDIVYAAAMGHCYGPQEERGVFKTTDGGSTWKRVLFVDTNTGCSDIAMNPKNPRILIAGMWQLEMKTWIRESGGPGSGLYLSKDGGETWTELKGNGLPEKPLGKIAVAFAPRNPDRIYALIETAQFEFKGVLWRSDDAGKNWILISHDQEYTQRPHYYSRCVVSPVDDDEVYFMAHGVWKSVDGGNHAVRLEEVGGDDHDMWIDPGNPDRIIVGNDAGIALSVNRGRTWFKPPLPIAQMYHVEVDDRIPYFVYGNRQDGPSARGPSNTLGGKNIPIGFWQSIGGGECGFTRVDPVDNNIVWSASYDGFLTRLDLRTGHARNVTVWPDEPMGWPPDKLKYRWNWTFPFCISPHYHNKIYAGSQYVHVSTDGGSSWRIISPDLTTNDKSRQVTSGGLTIDNIGVDYGCTLFAIAESPLDDGLIWTGSNDGLVYVTQDGGNTWVDVSRNIPGLISWGTISNIHPSRFKAGTCYITVDGHQENDRNPYVYKTEDYGKKWALISGDIPKSLLSYAHCVIEDPKKEGMLYLGTENALYLSWNDGENWLPLRNNLPPAPIHWMVVQERFDDLVVATYGRGFWILDDISPLRRLNSEVLESDVFLFNPRPAYRFQSIETPMSVRTDADGRNPSYGASIHFYLKEEKKEPMDLIIRDKEGTDVRTIKVKGKKGINRLYWDLRHERAFEPKLRTVPLGHSGESHGPERLRYSTKGWRELVTWGNGGYVGPLAVPGTYTLSLKAGEEVFETSLDVLKDPPTTGSLDDIKQQVDLALAVRDDLSELAKITVGIEWLRRQIDDMVPLLKEQEDVEDVIQAVDELDQKCITVEKDIFQLTLTGTGADDLRGPTKLYS